MTANPADQNFLSSPDNVVAKLGERAASIRTSFGGLYGSSRSLVIAALTDRFPVVAIVPDMSTAEGLDDDLDTLCSDARTILFEPTDPELVDEPEGRSGLSERYVMLRNLREMEQGYVAIIPAAVLLESLPALDDVEKKQQTLGVGKEMDLDEIRRLAQAAGFLTVPMVSSPAEISIRGDIVDLFPIGERRPIRIELFDDSIESIRVFDVDTQRSIEELPSIAVPLLPPKEIITAGTEAASITEHLHPDTRLVFWNPTVIQHRLEEIGLSIGAPRSRVRSNCSWVDNSPGISLLSETIEENEDSANLITLSVQGIGGGIDALAESLKRLRNRCHCLDIFAESDGEVRRLTGLLKQEGLLDEKIRVTKGQIRSGFQVPSLDHAWLNHLELLGRTRMLRPRQKHPSVPVKAIRNLLELSEGDYVVHMTHGIARYHGTKRMTRDLGEEEFLILEFHGDTTFYLPTSKIDLVQRYVGSGGAPPRLDKIGGVSWKKKKDRVRAALEDLASDLLDIQASRVIRKGTIHPHDDPLIDEFEASFAHPDTQDQVTSMGELHADLTARKPMDRLLCGDVGFGKTELAVRAAFRIVCGGRQTAVLVPTTLLAEQHLRTFQARLASYAVRVESLSRFQSKKRQKEIIHDLKRGVVDIVIGTHRLLSDDLGFKELGLLIVDEEQRFGVKAKEALKRMRRAVDVLTLTATPIPRTLHMALVGIRDISSLNNPPPGRRPVKTEIRKFDVALIRKSIQYELNRGGQVFFVHNRVKSIDRIARVVAEAVPTARVAVAHGQMPERELENVTLSFAEGKFDVLVSTSIVESGLDLPHANTMIIDRPDLFGLADLHQLRGRVGRSDRQAFCYLLLPDMPLPTASEKRIKAVEELSHLGAGYDIAIKDLEIRGAGNLLGADQHGNIAAVGYDLYVRLLRKTVALARGRPTPNEPTETDVDLGVQAFLPAAYIPDAGQRMEILRRLGDPENDTPEAMEEEIRDRFGRLPQAAANLLHLFALKARCRKVGIRRLLYPGDDHVLVDVKNLRKFQTAKNIATLEAQRVSDSVYHIPLADELQCPEAVLGLLVGTLIRTDPEAGTRRASVDRTDPKR